MFWGGQVESRFGSTAPNVQLFGETPGSFPVRNWVVDEGRGINDSDVENSRGVTVIGAGLARTVFPFGDIETTPNGIDLHDAGLGHATAPTSGPERRLAGVRPGGRGWGAQRTPQA